MSGRLFAVVPTVQDRARARVAAGGEQLGMFDVPTVAEPVPCPCCSAVGGCRCEERGYVALELFGA